MREAAQAAGDLYCCAIPAPDDERRQDLQSMSMSPLRNRSLRLARENTDLRKRLRCALAAGNTDPACAQLSLAIDQKFDVRERR